MMSCLAAASVADAEQADVMFRLRPLIDLFTQLLDRHARRLAARSGVLFVVVFVLRGALPLAAANQLRLILDALGTTIEPQARVALVSRLSWLVIGWGALMWGASALGAWSTLLTEEYSRAIQRRVQEVVNQRAVSLDLSWFEDSRFHEALYRAQHDHHRRHQHHSAFDGGRHEFNLAVAVRMLRVGGAMGEHDRIPRQ